MGNLRRITLLCELFCNNIFNSITVGAAINDQQKQSLTEKII